MIHTKPHLIYFIFLFSCAPQKEPTTGVFIDERDQEQYNFAQFGNDIWMTENLRFKTNSAFAIPNTYKYYGLLYTWNDACKICPKGWHLPDDRDWDSLEVSLGLPKDSLWLNVDRRRNNIGNKLKKGIEWGKIFPYESGWNAVPTGKFYSLGHYHWGLGEYASFWTSNPLKEDEKLVAAITREMFKDSILYKISENILNKLSVRCVKDKTN